jgi:hypothetical protein
MSFGYRPPLLDSGGESDNNAVRLGTRRTRHVKNEMRLEAPRELLRIDLEKCRSLHPFAEMRSVTNRYNCVGMVFATRRTWVEPEYVPLFLNDDDYRRLPSLQEAEIGDIVVYKTESGEIAHVGIVAIRDQNVATGTTTFKILSKWGPWAEFVHDPDDVLPNFGQLAEVWTDRKSI